EAGPGARTARTRCGLGSQGVTGTTRRGRRPGGAQRAFHRLALRWRQRRPGLRPSLGARSRRAPPGPPGATGGPDRSNRHKTLAALALAVALAGCATDPAPPLGEYLPVTPQQASAGAHTRAPVRLGGQVAQAAPRGDRPCSAQLSPPLDNRGRP